MSAAHTPGPWTFSADGSINAPSAKVAVVGAFHFEPIVERSKARWLADAAMISAAPDLLEALKLMMFDDVGMEWAESEVCDYEWDAKTEAAKIKARAAIRKATGAA